MRGLGGARRALGQGRGEGGAKRRHALLASTIAATFAASLAAAPGAMATYGLAGVTHTGVEAPVDSVSVDPVSKEVVISALLSTNFNPGFLLKFDCSEIRETETCAVGSPNTFGTGYFASVTMDPSGDLNALFAESTSGPAMIGGFNPTSGAVAPGYPFEATSLEGSIFKVIPQIAVDSTGNIYVPDSPDTGDQTIKVFDPGAEDPGVAVETIDCETLGCPGGAFNEPKAVAIDGSDNLYVADKGNGRIVKIPPAGSPSVPISGVAVGALAIDTTNGHIFVGGDDGEGFHISEYTGTGTKVGDFGQGLFKNIISLDNLAVDSVTGDVYVVDTIPTLSATEGVLYTFSPIQPSAETTPAVPIAQTTATLNGEVNPNEGGAITSCEFEYGTTTAYGSTVPCSENPEDGSSEVPVKADVSGLALNTTYHFQLVVSNGGEAVKGGDVSFTTLPNAPSVTTEAATGLSQVAATLHASVDAEGDSASCLFEYGPSTAYGKSVACSSNPVTGTEATAVSVSLSGLSAGTTYHFRVVAHNKGGTSKGEDLSFTTAADTCATNAALCPPPPPPPSCANTPSLCPPPPTKPLTCKKGFKKRKVHGKFRCIKIKHKHHKHH
jgi:NHL repeat